MEITIADFQYPHVMGSFARPPPPAAGVFLGESPPDFPSFFNCHCGRELYDGGIGSAVNCTCGLWLKRTDDGSLSVLSGEPLENKWKSRGFAEPANLTSVTFGVFSSGIGLKYLKGREIDLDKILNDILRKFFKRNLRCIEENLIFSYENFRFKVTACQPRQGFVVRFTRLHLTSKLQEDPIKHLEVIPVEPHTISDEIFESVFLPYFTKQEVHLHEGQHLSVYGLDCLVLKSKPRSGFVVAEVTSFTYSESPFPFVQRLELLPFIEDLPPYFTQVTQEQMTSCVVHFFLMPHFLGWKRLVRQGQVLEICGIDFKVTECLPAEGLVSDFSVLKYDGSTVSRRRDLAMAHEIQQLQNVVVMIAQNMQSRENHLNSLAEFTLNHPPSDSDQKSCVICLSDFEAGQKMRVFPCCNFQSGHIFHKGCSDKWLLRNLACPICKTVIK
jgi:hypothetical protein